VDLRGKVARVSDGALPTPMLVEDEAAAALIALGYSATETSAALRAVPPATKATTEDRVREALRGATRRGSAELGGPLARSHYAKFDCPDRHLGPIRGHELPDQGTDVRLHGRLRNAHGRSDLVVAPARCHPGQDGALLGGEPRACQSVPCAH